MKNKYRMSALIGCLIAIATAHATPPVTLPIGSVETMKAAAVHRVAGEEAVVLPAEEVVTVEERKRAYFEEFNR